MVKPMGKTLEVNSLPGPSFDLRKKTNNVSEMRRLRAEADHAHLSMRNTCKL